MAPIFPLWNSKTQPSVAGGMAWWGCRLWFSPLCCLISCYSCNLLPVCHSLTGSNGLSLNKFRWSNHACSLPPWGWKWIRGWPDICFSWGEFTSILPVSSYSGRWFAMTDGAMPGRVERHKQLIRTFLLECLLSASADEWQLWLLNLTAKTKNLMSMSTKDS